MEDHDGITQTLTLTLTWLQPGPHWLFSLFENWTAKQDLSVPISFFVSLWCTGAWATNKNKTTKSTWKSLISLIWRNLIFDPGPPLSCNAMHGRVRSVLKLHYTSSPPVLSSYRYAVYFISLGFQRHKQLLFQRATWKVSVIIQGKNPFCLADIM